MGARVVTWQWIGLLAIWIAGFAPSAAAQNLYTDLHFGGSLGMGTIKMDRTDTNFVRAKGNDDDRSIVGGAALGFRFPLSWALDMNLPRHMPDLGFRTELEFSAGREYQFRYDAKGAPLDLDLDSEVDAMSLFANFFLEVPFYRKWALFGGAGAGVSRLDTKVVLPSLLKGKREKDSFSWQAGGGIEYSFDEQVTMGFGYRYVDLGDVTVSVAQVQTDVDAADAKTSTTAHEFMLRLRVNFYTFR